MFNQTTFDEFLSIVRKSALVDAWRLDDFISKYQHPADQAYDPKAFLEQLARVNLITKWQAHKLLQGKYRGFFLGKYKILSLIGKGGMGAVYLAEHQVMRRLCALKVLPTARDGDTSYLERFHREAQAVALLDHPNIVRAYDIDQQFDGKRSIHFLVMEYVEGTSLQEIVDTRGVLSPCDAAEYIRQTAIGLQHAHERGMVHRDIKPGNLLVDRNGTLRILDLGLARFFVRDDEQNAISIRHDEKVLGTADYLSPEQALDSHNVDARSDLYSLGCTFYFLLTRRPPFIEGTLAQRLLAHQVKTPDSVQQLRPSTPPSLAAIVEKLMQKSRGDRFATAQETSEVLLDWIRDNANDEWRAAHPKLFAENSKSDTKESIPVALPVQFSQPSSQVKGPGASSSNSATQESSGGDNSYYDAAWNQFITTLRRTGTASTITRSEANPEDGSSIISEEYYGHIERTSPSQIDGIFGPNSHATRQPSSRHISIHSHALNSLKQRRIVTQSVSQRILKSVLTFSAIGAAIFFVFAFREFLRYTIWDDTSTRYPPDKRELVVGGSFADFRTIREAIYAVRSRYQPTSDDGHDRFLIRVRSGVYRENLRVDGQLKPWPEGIVLRGDGNVVLESPDGESVVRINSVARMTIENITVNARGTPVAVELTNDLNELRLVNLTISGYTDAGVTCSGAQGTSFGNRQVILEGLSFEPESETTTGIRLDESIENDVKNIVIRDCRFLVPMEAGISFRSSAPYGITIQQNVFCRTIDGIRFDGSPLLKSIQITNNSFFETEAGIRFRKQPNELSRGLVFRRNLFSHSNVADAIVQANYDEGQFRSFLANDRLGVDSNWSDDTSNDPPIPGFLQVIFENGGRQGNLDFAFTSVDINNPRFLAPSADSPQRKVDEAQQSDKKWVGAIGPK